MAYRRLMKYPPANVLFTVQLASKSEEALAEAADSLAAHITPQADEEKIQMIGPVDDILIKIRNQMDWFQQEKRELFKGVMVQYDFS